LPESALGLFSVTDKKTVAMPFSFCPAIPPTNQIDIDSVAAASALAKTLKTKLTICSVRSFCFYHSIPALPPAIFAPLIQPVDLPHFGFGQARRPS
jgi:hypothetical protein